MWPKRVRWYYVESDILKEGPWGKYPGRWEIAERKIPSVKLLFKTNSKGHKHPSTSLFIIEQNTIGETTETNKCHSTQEPQTPQNSPVDCDGLRLHQYWTTLPVYVYIRLITRTSIKNAYVNIYIYRYILTQSFWTGTKVIRRKHIIQAKGFVTYSFRSL